MPIYKYHKPKVKSYHRINHQIKASRVRLVGEEPSAVLSLNEALQKANKVGLDLVEVAPQADPPVVRIIDYKKFLYELKQKQKRGKAKPSGETKELRFRPFIGQNDLEQRISRAKDFLKDKNRVKITVQFRGREITHPGIAQEKLDYIIKQLGDVAQVERSPKLENRTLTMSLVPK